jgi:hypothetical protein
LCGPRSKGPAVPLHERVQLVIGHPTLAGEESAFS